MKYTALTLLFFAILGLCEAKGCIENHCKNGGTCIDINYSKYKCNCLPGYIGKNCQIDICSKKPCKNGGKCVPHTTGYFCNCKVPFVGTHCQTPCNINADIMIAVDESGSISLGRFKLVIDFVISIVKVFDIFNGKVRIGLITFAHGVFFHFDLKAYNNKADLITMVDLLRYNYSGGATNTEKALRYLDLISFTSKHGDRRNVPNYVFMITDGKSRHPSETRYSAFALKTKGVTIFTFGFGFNVRVRELCIISSSPSTIHVVLRPYNSLPYLMDRFIAHNCKVFRGEKRCTACNEDCHCTSGMKCCNGCCQNTVIIEFCKRCPRGNRCVTNRHCRRPKSQCFHGCCVHPRFVYYYRCRGKGKKPDICRPGWKCCRGLCQRPLTLEVGCMGEPVCTKYPPRDTCGSGKKCCYICDSSEYRN